jgi:predicted RNA methylase
VVDPEGAHLAALRKLADFRARRVLEVGCGDGRLTLGIAAEADSVLAFDPDAEAVDRARRFLPSEYGQRITSENRCKGRGGVLKWSGWRALRGNA